MIGTRLSNVCEITMGQAPEGASYNFDGNGLPLLAGAGDFGDLFPSPSKFTTSPGKISKTGDIIVCIRATIGDLNWSDKEYCLGRGVAGLRPKNKELDKQYLWNWLRASKDKLEKNAKGSTFKQISRDDIASLQIPLPPLDEQKRIAGILDKADAIRRKRAESLKLLDDLLRATFLDMFGDPSSNPKNHPIIEVRHLLSNERAGTQSGPFGSALKKYEYVSDGIPVWGIDNVSINKFTDEPYLFISEEKYQQLQRYSAINGDILISRAGTVGRMCIVETQYKNSIISTNLVRVVLNKEKLLPDYFVGLFSYFADRVGSLRVNQKENAFSFLNPTVLKGLPIPVPPIKTQTAYSNIVRARKEIIHKNNVTALESDILFHSLVARAFKGEL